jgi:hypothetical protein
MRFAWVIAALSFLAHAAQGQILFSDNFTSAASPLWSNDRGNWSASGGVYDAAAPNNNPITATLVNLALTDFAFDVDINNASDGGLWLRADAGANNGILLVTKPSQLYWHIVNNGNAGAPLNVSNSLPGGNIHVHVEVSGDNYAAFINGSLTPLTTLTTSFRSSGFAGLYDFSGQSFDNVAIAPEPLAAPFALLAGLVLRRRR